MDLGSLRNGSLTDRYKKAALVGGLSATDNLNKQANDNQLGRSSF